MQLIKYFYVQFEFYRREHTWAALPQKKKQYRTHIWWLVYI